MKKNKTLPEQLKSYSLLAGSMVASSLAAQGQVIYTDVIPDKELGGVAPSSFPDVTIDNLDLNNDGLFDFKITLGMYDELPPDAFSFREKIDGDFNPSNAIRTYTIEYVPYILKINAGDYIPLFNFYGFHSGNFAFQFASGVAYNWNNVTEKFVGLKFKAGTNTHYGWLRLYVNTADTVPNIIIRDYAYEKTPDKKIQAGDTGLGPSTALALLEAENKLAVFPNPSGGHCVIKLGQPLTGEVKLSVKDALGRNTYQEVIPMTPQRKELPFDFSNFAPGVYFIQLSEMTPSGNPEAASLTCKWIKN